MTTPDVLDVLDVGQLHDDAAGDPVDTPEDDAPYGRKADGTPRRKPGPPAGAGRSVAAPRARTRRTRGSSRRTASLRTPAAAPAAPAAPAGVDPVMFAGAQALIGVPTRLIALAGLAVGIGAKRYPEDSAMRNRTEQLAVALSADSATLVYHGDALATVGASLAEPLPWLAGVYAKAAQVGPYAGAVEAGAAIVLQVLCNHGFVPAHPMLGTIPPAEMIQKMMGDENQR